MAGSLPVFQAPQFVQASGAPIQAAAYSVPMVADWNSDGLPDLLVGESTSGLGKVRVYLNSGTRTQPVFNAFAYARSAGGDVSVPAAGCLGICPRVVDWNGDGRKDLVAGRGDGSVQVFLNVNTDAQPEFDGGSLLTVGEPGVKANFSSGARAMVEVVDWNNDGVFDLLAGGLDGKVRLLVNEAKSGAPDFRRVALLAGASGELTVPSGRSAIAVADLDGDGRKDLLAGNTEGQLYFYANSGTDAAPAFGAAEMVAAGGLVIDLDGLARSRPSICDFNGDGTPDLLVGGLDGKVRLYLAAPLVAPPRLVAWALEGHQLTLTIEGAPGRNYTLQCAASLNLPVRWTDLCRTAVVAAPFVLTDTNVAGAQGWYRVRQDAP